MASVRASMDDDEMDGPVDGINITPLVDVLMVVLVIVTALVKDYVHEGAAHEGLVVFDPGSVLAATQARSEQVTDQGCEHDRRDARDARPRAVPRADEPPDDQADGNAV